MLPFHQLTAINYMGSQNVGRLGSYKKLLKMLFCPLTIFGNSVRFNNLLIPFENVTAAILPSRCLAVGPVVYMRAICPTNL